MKTSIIHFRNTKYLGSGAQGDLKIQGGFTIALFRLEKSFSFTVSSHEHPLHLTDRLSSTFGSIGWWVLHIRQDMWSSTNSERTHGSYSPEKPENRRTGKENSASSRIDSDVWLYLALFLFTGNFASCLGPASLPTRFFHQGLSGAKYMFIGGMDVWI